MGSGKKAIAMTWTRIIKRPLKSWLYTAIERQTPYQTHDAFAGSCRLRINNHVAAVQRSTTRE
jgi:hypothetical protein